MAKLKYTLIGLVGVVFYATVSWASVGKDLSWVLPFLWGAGALMHLQCANKLYNLSIERKALKHQRKERKLING